MSRKLFLDIFFEAYTIGQKPHSPPILFKIKVPHTTKAELKYAKN
jgi:hypothetical protein